MKQEVKSMRETLKGGLTARMKQKRRRKKKRRKKKRRKKKRWLTMTETHAAHALRRRLQFEKVENKAIINKR